MHTDDETRRHLEFAETLIDAAPIIVLLLSPEGVVQHANAYFERLTGYRVDEIRGKDWFDTFLPARERDGIRALFETAAHGSPTKGNVNSILTRGGEEREIEWSDAVIRDENGAIVSLLAIGTDITDRRNTETALQASQAMLLEAQRIAHIGSWELDLIDSRLTWSDQIYSIFEIDKDRFGASYEAFLDAIHPDDRGAVNRVYTESVADRTPYQIVHRLRMPDGRIKWVEERGRTFYDPAGNPLRSTGTVQDITERMLAANALAEARTNLTDAIESIDHAILLLDRDDRVIVFNQHFIEYFPALVHSVGVGVPFAELLHAAVDGGSIAVPSGQDKKGLIAERLARHRCPDGKPFDWQLADGRVLRITEYPSREGGVIVILVDVTAQLQVEYQLREAQKMEAIGKLTGGLAHDFNNYLGVIIGNLELLQISGADESQRTKYIGRAMAGLERASELTKSLLAFSRRQPLNPRPVDVGRRIQEIAKLLHRTIGEDIRIVTDLAPDMWSVTVDGPQLDSSIVNLANNARDAMPRGGTIMIKATNIRFDQAYASSRPGTLVGDYVMIGVSDTGEGMPPEVLARAFEPFFTTKETAHGTGLGLSMVYGFVKQSGGHITIHSEPGGVTVRIYLPRTDAEEAPSDPQTPSSASKAGTESILLVEDNEAVRETAVAQLTSLGYRVIAAPNGDAAVKILERAETPVDLLFTDVVMPGMLNGYALAKVVSERWPDIRILLASGYTGEVSRADALRRSRWPLLTKPYHLDSLARTIREILG